MIKPISVRTQGILLKRRNHTRPDEIIVWDVLDLEKRRHYGVIRQVYDNYVTTIVGWRAFKVKYWIGSKFAGPEIIVTSTRAELIKLIIGRKAPEIQNVDETNGKASALPPFNAE